jgi:hypothetical protein
VEGEKVELSQEISVNPDFRILGVSLYDEGKRNGKGLGGREKGGREKLIEANRLDLSELHLSQRLHF